LLAKSIIGFNKENSSILTFSFFKCPFFCGAIVADFDEDQILVEQVLAGRLEAFDELVRKYQKWIFYFVIRILKRHEEADEVTQKTFIQVYHHLGEFRFKSSFKTWLTKIALNLARNHLKSLSRRFFELSDQISDPKSEEGFETSSSVEEGQQWLKEALEELPPIQKEVIVLRIYQELSFKEIADAMESREGNAKVNFHHGMKRLKEIYKKYSRTERLKVKNEL
jgi:RNA polymerase sigma-70 factor (ECF subfamily)